MQVTVCRTEAGRVSQQVVELPEGASVGDALLASGLAPSDWAGAIGIHGQRVGQDQVLAPGDRVELYHPLPHDPRTRRRERAAARRRSAR